MQYILNTYLITIMTMEKMISVKKKKTVIRKMIEIMTLVTEVFNLINRKRKFLYLNCKSDSPGY